MTKIIDNKTFNTQLKSLVKSEKNTREKIQNLFESSLYQWQGNNTTQINSLLLAFKNDFKSYQLSSLVKVAFDITKKRIDYDKTKNIFKIPSFKDGEKLGKIKLWYEKTEQENQKVFDDKKLIAILKGAIKKASENNLDFNKALQVAKVA